MDRELHAAGSKSKIDVHKTDNRSLTDHDAWETASDRVCTYIDYLFSWSEGVGQEELAVV